MSTPDASGSAGADSESKSHPMALAVITTSGVFPNLDDYRRGYSTEVVRELLAAAALQLGLTNTADWVATVGNRPINEAETFAANDLYGIVEIEWHKREGGGGA
ncbi:hypothetical protein [Dyella sp. S184]|uniref:hypothetical protein n=1 Tax=Dyella sp. S184 TaxID=1641862 RepID=UPI00131BC156|nr:hypothetical protein [Dyella sp. S184]